MMTMRMMTMRMMTMMLHLLHDECSKSNFPVCWQMACISVPALPFFTPQGGAIRLIKRPRRSAMQMLHRRIDGSLDE